MSMMSVLAESDRSATAVVPMCGWFLLRNVVQPVSILILCTAFSSTVFSAPVAGDINQDGRVSAVDVQFAVNILLGLDIASFDADIDANRRVNVLDVQLVVNAVLGLDIDVDKDGLCDKAELNLGTDPADPDSDDDGLRDWDEVQIGTDPMDPDPDGDGLADGAEIDAGTDPFDPDTDDDGLADGVEVHEYKTDPVSADSDGDGVGDAEEIAGAKDPLVAAEYIVINEFAASTSNDHGIEDEDGDYPDWLELYNSAHVPIALEGWSLTDEPQQPTKWTFPDVTIGNGEYLVVFASGKNRAPTDGTNLHTNFRLSRAGEYLGLYNARGIPQVSSVFDPRFPTQLEDVSYGLYAEEDAGFAHLHPVTPGEPNENVNVYLSGPDSWPDGNTDPPYYPWIFRQDEIMDYAFEIRFASWETMSFVNPFRGTFRYVLGTVTIGNEMYTHVGIRFKGYSSFMGAGIKKPFKVDFNRYDEGQDYLGVTKLNFGNSWSDPTMMREVLGYEVFAAAGCPASRTSYVNLYVTVPGLYNRELFGVYVVVEQVDRPYLADRFGNDEGNLYKAGNLGADLVWLGPDPAEYGRRYEKKTNEEEDDWSDFIHFLDVLNNTPDDQFKSELEQVFNVDGFLNYLAASTVLSNMDSVAGRNANFYLYNNPPIQACSRLYHGTSTCRSEDTALCRWVSKI